MFILDKIQWKRLAESDSTPREIRGAITELFIPYKIGVEQFMTNYNCMRTGRRFSEKMQRECSDSVFEIIQMRCFGGLPAGCTEWFCAAFPDVFHWSLQEGKMHLEKDLQYVPDDSLDIETTQRRHMKRIVESYLRHTYKKLELAQ